MRVLMFGWEFPPNITGGLGTACYGLTKGLSSLGDVDVLFVVPKAFGNEEKGRIKLMGAGDVSLKNRDICLEENGRVINYLEVESKLVPYVDPADYWKLKSCSVEGCANVVETDVGGKIRFSGKYGPDLMAEITNYALVAGVIAREHEFDVIHAHDWLAYPAGITAKQNSGKPLVIHVHATDFDRSGGSVNPQVFAIEKRGMEAADKIITVSNLTRRMVIEKYEIDPSKVITIYNAVEPPPVDTKAASPNLMQHKLVTFLGRITYQKGPEYFVEAARLVLDRMDNVRFVMSGTGDMMSMIVSLVARFGISDKFYFTGFLKGNDVFEMLQMSDVFVMPSVSEPFGITPLEAMHCGVPVIISKQSGISEILRNAIKVDFWDTFAIADAIHGLLQYPALGKFLKRNGENEVNNRKWINSAWEVREIYKMALSA